MKKIFVSFLLITVFNFLVGCYSYQAVTVHAYSRIEEEDIPDDIQIMTKDYRVYFFSEGDFYFENDSLYGKGKLLLNGEENLVETKIAVANIADIEINKFDWLKTILLSVGIYLGVGLIIGIIIGSKNRIGS